MLANLQFAFDPTASVFGVSIRLETLALAAVVFLVMLLVAVSAGRSLAYIGPEGDATPAPKLRRDDLILIAFGALPGAIVGARLSYALIHLDYYGSDPGGIADPGQGGLGLTLAVVGGIAAAASVARLLNVSVGRWLAVASLPALIGLGLGKLAMAAGGSGQGSFSDSSWATSYVGPGPWGSPNADIPALPSQLIEGALVLALAGFVFVLPSLLRLRLRAWKSIVRPGLAPRHEWSALSGGRRCLTLLGLWALVRFAAAFTWRDARILGPLGADQLVLLAVALVALDGPPVAGLLGGLRTDLAAWRAARRARLAREAAVPQEVAAGAKRAAAADAEDAAAPADAAKAANSAEPVNAAEAADVQPTEREPAGGEGPA